jgi:S-adenosylmethionine:tRNA ribosyltransferase-isomerase
LPNERIAHHPLPKRDDSKLLVYKSGRIRDDRFFNLPDHLPENSLLVLNNTKVIEARLLFKKPSGGVIEIFCLQPHQQSMENALQQTTSSQWECLIGGASKWKPGQVLEKPLVVDGNPVLLRGTFKGKTEDGFLVQFDWTPADLHFVQVIHAAGAIPLPPYIKRSAEEVDSDRYQTIFGKHEGSVAAPTAALHFTEEVFERLRIRNVESAYVTLNVGAGTFKPVKADTIAGHHMHGEDFTVERPTVEKIIAAERVIAVGTTSLRTLESLYWLGVKLLHNKKVHQWTLAQWEMYSLDGSTDYRKSLQAIADWMGINRVEHLHCRTSMIIVPGYRFKIPTAIVTNFHQPQSTLLLLIAAFIGEDWRKVYQHAMDNDYRFLSYGDSSLLWRQEG